MLPSLAPRVLIRHSMVGDQVLQVIALSTKPSVASSRSQIKANLFELQSFGATLRSRSFCQTTFPMYQHYLSRYFHMALALVVSPSLRCLSAARSKPCGEIETCHAGTVTCHPFTTAVSLVDRCGTEQ